MLHLKIIKPYPVVKPKPVRLVGCQSVFIIKSNLIYDKKESSVSDC